MTPFLSRGGEVVSREAHNLEIVGANPTPATKNNIKYLNINLIANSKVPA